MPILFIFLIGLCIGSFLSVVVFRLDKKAGILTGHSECPKCLQRIKWYDLFPVFSYILLKGRCRNCKNKISPVYILLELVTAFSFISFYIFYKPIFNLADFYYLTIITSFVVLIFFDYLYFILPDKVIFPMIAVSFLFDFIFRRSEIISLLLSALVLSSIFAILYLYSKGEWVGFGDVKLMFLIGLVLGFPLGFLSLLFSIWSAALVGIVLIILGKANRKTPLPFGTFLSGISILIIIFQNEIQKIIGQFF